MTLRTAPKDFHSQRVGSLGEYQVCWQCGVVAIIVCRMNDATYVRPG